jgi:peptidyl-prolyl cis-trans isomerase D
MFLNAAGMFDLAKFKEYFINPAQAITKDREVDAELSQISNL